MEIIKHYRVESLLAALLKDIGEFAKSHGVFSQYTVLVPNASIRNWLTQRITEEAEICVGINFISLNQFINQITASVQQEKTLLSKRQMTVLLQQLLPAIEQGTLLNSGPLQHWLQEQTSVESRARLCQVLADTFDAYQIFRPLWLDAWLEGDLVIGDSETGLSQTEQIQTGQIQTEKWQAELWRHLVDLAHDNCFLHRGQITEFLAGVVTEKHQTIKQKFPQVAIFGVHDLDNQTWQQLKLISEATRLKLFWRSPAASLLPPGMGTDDGKKAIAAQQNWYAGNLLLASWGYQARELALSLKIIEQNNSLPSDHSSSDCLLSQLQQRIFTNQDTRTLHVNSDHSLQIVSHYSRAREVEGLYDFLLQQFDSQDENPTDPKPHELLVLCPDVASYAPFIRATFEHPFNQKNIPYQICGLKHAGGGVSQLMADMLALPRTRYRKSEVLDILFNRFVRQQLKLSDEDVGTIKHWFGSANAHWGLDGTSLRQAQLPEYQQYTLQAALERILLGLSVSNEVIAGIDGNLFGIEGVSPLQMDLLNKLAVFFEVLTQWRDFCLSESGEEKAHALVDWLTKTREITRQMVKPPKADAGQLEHWFQLLGSLESELSFVAADSQEPMGYANYMAHISSLIEDYQRSVGNYSYGKVNIGSFGALKGIPANTIAILGLNETDFPRKPSINEFDLLAHHTQVGDRQPVHQDKDAFLNALLNARQTLYCSYVGQDIHNNKERIPSIMLRELMEFIVTGIDDKDQEQHLQPLQQPMHPFSSRFNAQQETFYTYRGYDRPRQKTKTETAVEEQQEAQKTATTVPLASNDLPPWKMPERVTIAELLAFLTDPAAAWFKNRLNVYLPDIPEHSSDEEPFTDSGLEAWKFKSDVINQSLKYGALTEVQKEQLMDHYIATSGLPHELRARESMQEWLKSADTMVNKINQLRQDRHSSVTSVDINVELAGKNVNIIGELGMFTKTDSGLLIHYDFKQGTGVKSKKLMSAILETRVAEHLKLHQSDFAYEATWFVDGSEDAVYQLQADKDPGTAGLRKILALYDQAMQQPVALNIDLAPEIAQVKTQMQASQNDRLIQDKFEEIIDDQLKDCSQTLRLLIDSPQAQDQAAELARQFVIHKLGTRHDSQEPQDHWVKRTGEKQNG